MFRLLPATAISNPVGPAVMRRYVAVARVGVGEEGNSSNVVVVVTISSITIIGVVIVNSGVIIIIIISDEK